MMFMAKSHFALFKSTNLGKLKKIINLNLAAIKGDDSPKIHHDSQGSVAVRS
jgi:hypothetical protein